MRRRFFRLALINILANVTVPLAGLVDTAMLGHLAEIRHLAGVALASVLFDYLYWGFGFLRMGTTGTTAQALGRGETAEVWLVLWRSLLLAAAIGLALVLLQVPLREAGFALLAGAPGVEEAGRAYFDARIWGAPGALCGFVLLGWYLGREEARWVLAMTVAANLANIALNWLFIVRLGLAARGAGLATMLSQYIGLAVAALILVFAVRPGPEARAPRERLLDRAALGAQFRLNGNILVRTLCLITSFALFVNFSSLLGTTVLAVNTILLRLQSLASYLIDGAAFASESLAGAFRGQADVASLRRLFRLSLGAGLGFAVAFLALLLAMPEALAALLTSHQPIAQRVVELAWWLVPVLLLGSLAYMYDGLFLGLTAGRTLRNTMLLSTVGVFLPAAAVAVWLESNTLLWLAMTLFMGARTLTLWAASRRELA